MLSTHHFISLSIFCSSLSIHSAFGEEEAASASLQVDAIQVCAQEVAPVVEQLVTETSPCEANVGIDLPSHDKASSFEQRDVARRAEDVEVQNWRSVHTK